MAALGLAAGSALGVGLSRWVLGFLDITSSGRGVIPVTPPMTLSVQEWLVSGVLAGLVAAALLGFLVAIVSAQRLRTAEILRAGE